MAKRMTKLGTAGKGAYGIVYIATDMDGVKDNKKNNIPEKRLYAIKRQFKEKLTTGYGNLREADMLTILAGHPYIVNLKNIEYNNPFKETSKPMTPIGKTDFKEMNEDKMLFVMEYLPYNGEDYIKEKTCTPFVIKVLMMQLMLAIEFIHSRGVVHRDIRTSNVLISKDEEGDHELKLCDFGLSRIMGDGKSTPGTITSIYRAPEVLTSRAYGRKVDIWSAGCVIYELVARVAFLEGFDDVDKELFDGILSRLPYEPSKKVIKKLFSNNPDFTPNTKPPRNGRISFVKRMKLSNKFKKDFESVPGSLDQLEDLLTNMLCLDPDERFTATRCLDHPFFDWTRDHINKIRQDFPPEPPPLPFYPIYPCAERSWVIGLSFAIFNSKTKLEKKIPFEKSSNSAEKSSNCIEEPDDMYLSSSIKKWYSHRILFHAIDMFDRYITHRLTVDKANLRDTENDLMGKLLTRDETYLYFYCCLYIAHKYYNVLVTTLSWDVFAPEIFANPRSRSKIVEFERYLTVDVLGVKAYRKTLLEISNEFTERLTEQNKMDLLYKLGTIKTPWLDKSVRALYRDFNNIPAK
jgi:serine/threonine protein kinase